MNEGDVRFEVLRLMETEWYWGDDHFRAARRCSKCSTLVLPPKGRPDLLAYSQRAPAVPIEVKVYRKNDTAFAFNHITPEQRTWLNTWTSAPQPGLAYLALGTVLHTGPSPERRRLWLVPWQDWLTVEARLSQYQQSLPLHWERARGEAKKQKLDATTLLAPYAVEWLPGYKKGRDLYKWVLPDDHPIVHREGPRRIGRPFDDLEDTE